MIIFSNRMHLWGGLGLLIVFGLDIGVRCTGKMSFMMMLTVQDEK